MTHGQWRGLIEEYRDLIDLLPDGLEAVTLREGGTPLVHSEWLSSLTGGQVWLKVEGDNPTGSFKDRGMTTAISVAKHDGAQAVVCASTGNTSASMAAYAAKAGLKPLVLVPEGKIAAGKMAQARDVQADAHAKLVAVFGADHLRTKTAAERLAALPR